MNLFLIISSIIIFIVLVGLYLLSLRRIVPSNQVHVLQKSRNSEIYGVGQEKGNVYYEFPSWFPVIGVVKSMLPTSVFDLDLSNYEAYDRERVPFVVDIKAFFRISNPIIAANRISSHEQLMSHLKGIVQGAVRSILAKEDLESIMGERTVYGDKFTLEVKEQLEEWGVSTVKNIELMDIRDSNGNTNIENIMKKKESEIEMESRVTVAENKKKAQEAEIFASQEVALKQQESQQQVGLKQAVVEQEVGIAQEKSKQQVQEQAKVTAEKEMEVKKVRDIQSAEIEKQSNIIKAEANKNVVVLNAEASKEQQELKAEADLIVATKNATGIEVQGKAEAEAEKAKQLAPVEAQIKLAKEIGENHEYQDYLISLEKIKAMLEVGLKQAENLSKAEIKIFANASGVSEGVNNVSNIFSAKNGLNISSLIEGLSATDIGKTLLDAATKNTLKN